MPIPTARFVRRALPAVLSTLFAVALSAPVPANALEAAKPADVGMSAERLDRLTATLERYVEDGRLPGAVTLVAREGKVVYHEAIGEADPAAGRAMRKDTIFRIASQTKALVSVGIMILQEEGKLTLGDELGRFIPAFAETTVAVPDGDGGYDIVPAKRPITIRDLLTHTAGIGYGYGPAGDRWEEAGIQGWYFADRDEPIAATVERMAALPFTAQPGEQWVYGYSTDILGVVIEAVSGMSLADFLDERIIRPLGMKDTHFYLPRSKAGRLAAVYSVTDDGGLERAPNPGGMVGQGAYVDGPRKSYSGGAGLLSTAADYARFLQMLLNGGELDGVRILGPKTVELMAADHLGELEMSFGDEGNGFGLGFAITLDIGAAGIQGSVGAYAWGGAYHTVYWIDPVEKLIVAYMTQVRPATGLDDVEKLRALVYQAIVE